MISYPLVFLAGIVAGIVICKKWTNWRNAALVVSNRTQD